MRGKGTGDRGTGTARPTTAAVLALALVAFIVAGGAEASEPVLLDGFDDVTRWEAAPADGIALTLQEDSGRTGTALRLDLDFQGRGGYAAVRRPLPLELPANYEFTFWVRGDVPPNNLEFKLIDATGENVWWVNRRDFAFRPEWQQVTIKKRHVSFAWGPAKGGELAALATLEIVVTAGQGGKGAVWLDDLAFRELPPAGPYAGTPQAAASSSASRRPAAAAIDGDPATAWQPSAPGPAWLAVDFGVERPLGGLAVDWEEGLPPRYEVQLSPDGAAWTTFRRVEESNGGRDWILLGDADARFVRLALDGGPAGLAPGVREIAVQPLEFGASRNAFFAALADAAPRGAFPRYLKGEQSYWTVVGLDRDEEEGLVGEDGAVEAGSAGFSLEPLVRFDGALVSWADVKTEHTLIDGDLPIPTVRWLHPRFTLEVTTVATGAPGRTALLIRYRFKPVGTPSRATRLWLAIRPFQVNPPWQFLGRPGGTVPVRRIAWDGLQATVGARRVVPARRPSAFGASTFDGGEIVEHLRAGSLPPTQQVEDRFGAASAAFAFDLWGAGDVVVALPLHDRPLDAAIVPNFEQELADARTAWRAVVDRVALRLPADGAAIADTVRANLAYVLINRDGTAIQPGSRAYDRSWIRDGSLTSTALLRLGHGEVARDFAAWFAGYQYPDGKVPCCVDARGADPVPEHDSHGELIHLVTEVVRYTGDDDFAYQMWPKVAAAASHIDALRAQRMTDEYRTPEKSIFYGLLPESISHEGYSDRPVHSYWDDFWAARGLADAAWLAARLGFTEEAARFAASRDEFRANLHASIAAVVARRGLDFVPGSADYGDFDATSTTIAVDPAGEEKRLPDGLLAATFERYWSEFTARRDGGKAWDAYTPYEARTIGTMVRLGWRARAREAAAYFLGHQRPAGWRAFAEVVWRDERAAKFVGDIPHTWCGSDFIRSALDMLAFERGDDTLVIGAGLPADWIRHPDGLAVRGLQTRYGTLDLEITPRGEATVVKLGGALDVPPGGLVLALPEEIMAGAATLDGGPAIRDPDDSIVLRALPVEIVFGAR